MRVTKGSRALLAVVLVGCGSVGGSPIDASEGPTDAAAPIDADTGGIVSDGATVDAGLPACAGMDCAGWASTLALAPRDATGATMAQAVANCVVQVHQSDCCGALRAYGVNHAARGSAGMPGLCQAETTCRAAYPDPTGCGSPILTVDTGDTTSDASLVRVRGVPATPCPSGVCVRCETIVCAAGDATCLSLEGITASQCGG